jgi:hypothetical protein
MIKPTPGRIVWYHGFGPIDARLPCLRGEPLSAIVACVHDDRHVNLSVCDAVGAWHSRVNVRLLQPEDEVPAVAGQMPYCQWMPFQQAQAARHEAAERAAAPG